MRVVVVGAGPIGLLCGGWLQSAGVEVCFVARGARLQALRSRPLVATGAVPFRLERVETVAHVSEAAPADAVLLGVKMYDLAHAGSEAVTALKPEGVMVGLQNGVSVYRTLRPLLAPERLAVGPVFTPASMVGPAEVDHSGSPRIFLGNPEVAPAAPVERLVALWRDAGVEAQLTDDINRVAWGKFVSLATNAALTCVTRLPAGVLYHDPDLLDLTRRFVDEVIAVGRAEGVPFPDDAAEAAVASLRRFKPQTVASMRQDLDAGKRLELDAITGEVVGLGRKHGVATPLNAMAYAALKPFRDGPPDLARYADG